VSAPGALWSAALDEYPTALGWAHDGSFLAVGTDQGALTVFGGADGAVLRRAEAHQGGVLALAWSPAARALATSGQDGAVRLWYADDDAPREIVAASSAWTETLAWHPDGRLLATATGKVARVWRAGGAAVSKAPPVESTISGVSWSPSGKQLALACYGGVRIVDPTSGARRKMLHWKGSMLDVAWRPQGNVIACGCQDNTVHFWRLPRGKDSMMSGYPFKPKVLSFSHDGALLATTGAPTVTVWRFDGKGPEGREPYLLDAHTEALTTVAFSPMVTMLASGCKRGEVHLWAPGEHERPVRSYRTGARVEKLAWGLGIERRTLLLAAADGAGTISVWPLS
jgi:WD40 repeat protein